MKKWIFTLERAYGTLEYHVTAASRAEAWAKVDKAYPGVVVFKVMEA